MGFSPVLASAQHIINMASRVLVEICCTEAVTSEYGVNKTG